jgi:hypothetical protein
VAHGGSGHAGTVDHDHTRPATHTGLRDHVVGLISWRDRHCLCGGSERQPEQSKHYRSDDSFLPAFHNSFCVVSEDRRWPASLKIVSSSQASASPDEPTVNEGPCGYIVVGVAAQRAAQGFTKLLVVFAFFRTFVGFLHDIAPCVQRFSDAGKPCSFSGRKTGSALVHLADFGLNDLRLSKVNTNGEVWSLVSVARAIPLPRRITAHDVRAQSLFASLV